MTDSTDPPQPKRRYRKRRLRPASDIRLFRLVRDATVAAIAGDKKVRGCEDDVARYLGSIWMSPQSENRRLADPSIAAVANQAGKGMDRTTAMKAIAALEERKYIGIIRKPLMKNSSLRARLKILPIWNFAEIEKDFEIMVRKERDAARQAATDRMARYKTPAPLVADPRPAHIPPPLPTATHLREQQDGHAATAEAAAEAAQHAARVAEGERDRQARHARRLAEAEEQAAAADRAELAAQLAAVETAEQIEAEATGRARGVAARLAHAMSGEAFPEIDAMTPRQVGTLVAALKLLWGQWQRVPVPDLIQSTIDAAQLA